MILFRGLLASLLLASAGHVSPAIAKLPSAATAAHDETSLIAAEDARFAAQVHRDTAAIEAGLGDELVYSHATGRRQTRAQYLDALRTGTADYRRIDPSERSARVYGDVGVTRAVLAMQVGERTMRSSVLGVYIWRAARWQLVSWQTTPLPDA
jgi:hypothetical protein